MTPKQQGELVALNDEAQRRDLTASERDRRDALVELYDQMMVRRAQAAALLKTRGYDLSDPAVLQPPAQA
jgi:rhodanese-related sulfurtransferase